jgi:hypothetical protein
VSLYGNGGSFNINARYGSLSVTGASIITTTKATNGYGGFAYIVKA